LLFLYQLRRITPRTSTSKFKLIMYGFCLLCWGLGVLGLFSNKIKFVNLAMNLTYLAVSVKLTT
jgi:hypothetical protein